MAQADPRHEEHAEERRDVDERRAEVGLDEHEPGRQRHVGDADQDEAQRPDASRVAGDEGGQRQQQRELADLGRLELEERQLDPAPRPARREAECEDGRDERDRAEIERPLEAPEALDVDERQHAQGDGPQREVDLLLDDERVTAGAGADDVEAECGDAGQGAQQQPVEPAQPSEQAHAPLAPALARAHPLAGNQDARHQVDSSTMVPRFGSGTLKTLE